MEASAMRVLTFTALSLLCAGAALAQTELTPERERITDSAIFRDFKAYEFMQGRIKALNDRGLGQGPKVSDYHLSKAQCWLDVSFHEYTRNDRSAFPGEALHQSERLVEQMEKNVTPLPDDTPLVNNADFLRKDLWDAAAALKKHSGWRCAAQKAACAEVELVHAGNEHKQQGWRHAKPYVQIAEDQIAEAQSAAAACVPPPPPSAPVVQAPPPPPAPVAPLPEPVTITANVLFNFDKHDVPNIRPQGRKSLDDLIARAKSGALAIERIELIGHADRLNSTGQSDYNTRLAERRAQTVRQLLIDAGLDATLIRADAKGDTQQVEGCREKFKSPKELQECLAANRRVEVRLVGETKR
jgi:outer membrane protein OmpA-like peptidoglycan-associated protein